MIEFEFDSMMFCPFLVLTKDNRKCLTQFSVDGQSSDNCIKRGDNKYYCSVSGTDVAECSLGLTENVFYKTCAGKSRILKCPSNYVIFINTGEYKATADGTCDTEVKCISSDNGYAKNSCGGKNQCTLTIFGLTIPTSICGSAPNKISFHEVDFTCLPGNDSSNILT